MASAGAASRAATGPTAPRHLLAYGVRALAAAGAGLVLAAGVGLVIWAVTPESGSPWTVVRGAIAGWGAANFLPPSIGGIAITLPPLLLTAVTAVLVASAANRGRREDVGPASELLGGVVVGLVHGAVVTGVVAALAPSGAYDADRGWAPVLLGVTSALLGVVLRGAAWRDVAAAVPPWVRAGLGAGLGGLLLLLAGGATVVAAGLIGGLGTAIDLGSMTAPTPGGGFGMLLLGLVFLPNALIAGTAYTVGVGFQIGTGTYSPWGTAGTDLPAVPLLAAVPDSGGPSWPGLITAVFPLLAAALIGRRMIRSVGTRRERMAGGVLAAGVTGIGLSLLALIAGGGIRGSDWATLVVPPLGVLAVTTGGLAVVAAAIAGVAGWGTVGWSGEPRPVRDAAAGADPATDTGGDLATQSESDPESDPGPNLESGQEGDQGLEMAQDRGADSDRAARSDPDPGQNSDSDSDSDPDADADSDAGSAPDSDSDADADAAPAPAPAPDSDPDADSDPAPAPAETDRHSAADDGATDHGAADDSAADHVGGDDAASAANAVTDANPADPPAGHRDGRH